MRNTTTISVKELPSHIASFVDAKRVDVITTDQSVHVGSQQWSEGSRDLYFAACLDGGEIRQIRDARSWPQNMGDLGEVDLKPRHVIIRKSVFCGRDMTPNIYALPSDVAPFLPKSSPELSDIEKQVLKCLQVYNSKGRESFRARCSMSKSQWDEIILKLASQGLAEKRGSLSIEGRNVARSIPDSLVY